MATQPNLDDLSPLDLSARVIDENLSGATVNRVDGRLSELNDDLAMVESFSHCVAFKTEDGLVLFDSSGKNSAVTVTDSLRSWSKERIATLVYTHGHVDLVGGSGNLIADNRERGYRDPRVIGHEQVAERFARYRKTNDWNIGINRRQFGGARGARGLMLAPPPSDAALDRSKDGAASGGGSTSKKSGWTRFLPDDVAELPDTFATRTTFKVGDLDVELRHARGETDDHAWAWIADKKTICSGDMLIWAFPNAGNPQKVQRYPGEWAASLREMASLNPELLVPAHGLPIAGKDRIATVLVTIAEVLEKLVAEVVSLMNDGAPLDEILHTVKVPQDKLALPYMTPTYDEPEFVVRNIWRLYGGWWNGDPAELKPAPAANLATEMVNLSGGGKPLLARAEELAAAGDLRMACHLVETASLAEPSNGEVHEVRAAVYRQRRTEETSLMAKGIYMGAVRESEAKLASEDG
jgi:glyoxylase-like metal-dependent hydrolase (beta-lactamase superfamily II)